MKTKIALLAATFFTLISCNQKVAPTQDVKVLDLYTIEVPGTFAPMQELYPDADIQYGNTFKQMYLVTTHQDKNKTANFEEYVKQSLASYNKRENYEIIVQEDVRINGIPGKKYEIMMSQDKDMMYMVQVILDGKKANYQYITWTTGQNKEAQKDNFLNTLASFKEQ
ncbi:hypothetical protein HX057_11090 [Myroides odoratimimus]|uniref:hypothetical protein n=1 Tax=Myroides odoratimimus TaxID=76832 RepID=UPI0010401445|nr:hypothetical protein [Myroides odoratimimus]MCA4792901.1 hypothetical protein [Myroides odoratimimus]MCA4820228.1 hypothetical protein [Myroides odoratimimus]MCO7723091.1 hypothetical protein [Myroides odoratimimus]MDM1034838.1 hypothetical protein [Myroides odoratimimus]MDM1038173.1 hypothetical protein [Myroides odoratimimus]